MGLVSAESARVADRRRARLCQVLLVDETSIRRRHRYVTVVPCGDSDEVLAMIPGRTKRSLARFFRDLGAWWCRQVEMVVSDGSRSYQAAIAQYLSDALHMLDRFHVAGWFTEPHPDKAGDTTPPPRAAASNIRTGPVPSPLSPSCGARIISATPTRSTSTGCSTLTHGSEPRGTRSKSSTGGSTRPTTSIRPTRRWDGSLTSTPQRPIRTASPGTGAA